jgi:hypothetical protein
MRHAGISEYLRFPRLVANGLLFSFSSLTLICPLLSSVISVISVVQFGFALKHGEA